MEKLRSSYKHRRMQSKNLLVNQYRSLSLMQGENLEKYLQDQKNGARADDTLGG